MKKTSKEWYAEAAKNQGIEILEFGGWNQRNFDYSFNKESITKGEFESRLQKSLVRIRLNWMPLSDDVLKSSDAWYAEIVRKGKFEIVDPSGWNKNDFKYSFNQELVTRDEFDTRLIQSTLRVGITWIEAEGAKLIERNKHKTMKSHTRSKSLDSVKKVTFNI